MLSRNIDSDGTGSRPNMTGRGRLGTRIAAYATARPAAVAPSTSTKRPDFTS
jgi:hypothetical protein